VVVAGVGMAIPTPAAGCQTVNPLA
jgi:hypothetical protein